MTENEMWCDVNVKLDTNERISGELADLLFNCGIEILRKGGDAVICNQTDVVSVDGEIYISSNLGEQRVGSLETALSASASFTPDLIMRSVIPGQSSSRVYISV